MTATQNSDDLLIVSDEVKQDNDFLFFDDIVEAKEESPMISFEETKEEEKTDFVDFWFSLSEEKYEEEKEETKEEKLDFEAFSLEMPETSTQAEETISDSAFSFDLPLTESKQEEKEEIFSQAEETKEESFSFDVKDNIASTVWDLNDILEETISKLELRKTNLGALRWDKNTYIDDLNKQIADLKSKVKDLEAELKSLETEDTQIEANITALQSMKMWESSTKKSTKKIA